MAAHYLATLRALPLALLIPVLLACSTPDSPPEPVSTAPVPTAPATKPAPDVDLTTVLLSNKDLSKAINSEWVPAPGTQRSKTTDSQPTTTPLAVSPTKCDQALPFTNTWTPATVNRLDQLSQAQKVSLRESDQYALTSWSTTARLTSSPDLLSSFLAQTTLADSSCTGARVVTLDGIDFHKTSQNLDTTHLLCTPGVLHITEALGPVLVHTKLTYPSLTQLPPEQASSALLQYNRATTALADELGLPRTELDLNTFLDACSRSLAQADLINEVAADLWDQPTPPPIG